MGDISEMKSHPSVPLSASQGPRLRIYALVTVSIPNPDTDLGEGLFGPWFWRAGYELSAQPHRNSQIMTPSATLSGVLSQLLYPSWTVKPKPWFLKPTEDIRNQVQSHLSKKWVWTRAKAFPMMWMWRKEKSKASRSEGSMVGFLATKLTCLHNLEKVTELLQGSIIIPILQMQKLSPPRLLRSIKGKKCTEKGLTQSWAHILPSSFPPQWLEGMAPCPLLCSLSWEVWEKLWKICSPQKHCRASQMTVN